VLGIWVESGFGWNGAMACKCFNGVSRTG